MAKAVLEDDSLEDKRKKVMLQILNMLHKTKASHIGSCFSVLDILLVLYEKILNVDPTNPNFEKRDYLLLSKGHAAAALYAVLAERGFFDKKELDTYLQENSSFLENKRMYSSIYQATISTAAFTAVTDISPPSPLK